MHDMGNELPMTAQAAAPSAPASAAPGAENAPVDGTHFGGEMGHAVARVARLRRTAAAKMLRDLGLYPGQEQVMMLLRHGKPMRQSDIITAVDLDPSTVTKMLKRMEVAGHVRRHRDPRDGRAVLIEPVDAAGCDILAPVQQTLERLEDQSLAGLTTEERQQLVHLLGKLETNLRVAAECPITDERH